MAFDEGLAERIRDVLIKTPHIGERRMFGGIAFLADGHMFVGVLGDALMARVGPANYAAALKRAHVREMDFTGKPMKGYVYVEPAGVAGDEELEEWVMQCRAFVRTLPGKYENEAVPTGKKAKRTRQSPQ